MTKTDAAVQTLQDINPDVVLEVSGCCDLMNKKTFKLSSGRQYKHLHFPAVFEKSS